MIKISENKILIIIVLVALLTRLPNIDAYFSGDEIDTVGPARNFLAAGHTYQFLNCDGSPYYNNTHPQFRIIFYTLWASIFGISSIAIRAVPLLFGIATILLTYLIGKRLYSKKAGTAAAIIMALSRYHIYASQLVSNDNTLFIFLFEAAVYFFLIYNKNNDKKSGILAATFVIISLSAKITFLVLVPTILLLKRNTKRNIFIIILAAAAFFAILFSASVVFSDPTIFSGPTNIFGAATGSGANTDLYGKFFYAATITWQLTPFLAALLVIAIATSKRDENYWFLLSWILIPLFAFLAISGDVQRYYMISLPAIFLLLGRFLEKLDFREKHIWAAAATVFVMALAMGLDDLMGYYNVFYILVFYVTCAVFLLFKERRTLLLGGAIGLSLFFAFTPGFVMTSGGEAVKLMVEKSSDLPYNETWTSKDINFYLTPLNEPTRLCEADPQKISGATYLSVYNLPDEAPIYKISDFCEKNNFIYLRNRTIGIVCRVSTRLF